MSPLTRSCFLLLLLGKLCLLALPVLLVIFLRSPWSPSLPPHALALIPFTLAKVRLSPTSTLSPSHDLVLWTNGSVPFAFSKGGFGVLSSYLKLCGRSGMSCLCPSVLSDYNGSPDTRFSRGTTRLMSRPDGERYLRPPQSLVVSFLLSLVPTLVFSRTGGVLFHRNSLTRRLSRFPPKNLCSLCPLSSSLQRTQPSFRFLSL